MIRLNCDYLEGCHPSILRKLTETNMEQTPGYGMDHYCEEAAEKIKAAFSCPEANVHFLVGGTQTNTTVIAAALRPYEGVLCAHTGHINAHETGAIESSGHKCLALPGRDGLISASQVSVAVALQGDDEHVVKPGMVYISMSTELGTIYNLAQLKDLYFTCRQHGLYLFIDGARLGYALAAPTCDLTPADIARYCDVFTVGGTKMGALFGEALILARPHDHFRWHMKQRGAVLAKGRLLGIQFEALLKDGLYFDLGRHANALAVRLRDGMAALGVDFPVHSPSNQQFPVLPNGAVAALEAKGYGFEADHAVDEEHTCVRFVTSWATPPEAVEQLLADLGEILSEN